MRKTPMKMHPLQERIDAFQKSTLGQTKTLQKGEEVKLRKIGRNKVIFKQVSLPVLNPILNKQNCKPNHNKDNQISITLSTKKSGKNLSFEKGKSPFRQQRLNRNAESQKNLNENSDIQKMKDILLKKQFLIHDKKMLPQRNCLSAIAQHRKDQKEPLPQKVKQLRKMRFRKSRQFNAEQIQKQLPLQEQARRLAREARPSTAPNAAKHQFQSASLEDFLNKWKELNVD